MLKIGITGAMGSGKTTICRIFEHLGAEAYCSDEKAKQFYYDAVVKQEIKNIFGEGVFDAMENVDTKKLANIVFQDKNLLKKLNNLIHPLVVDDFQKWYQKRENQNFVLFESAIIYQCGLENLFDKIIFVDAPAEMLLQRSAQRDKVDAETAKQRLKNQQTNNKGLSHADFVIHNDGKHSLLEDVIRIYNTISQRN